MNRFTLSFLILLFSCSNISHAVHIRWPWRPVVQQSSPLYTYATSFLLAQVRQFRPSATTYMMATEASLGFMRGLLASTTSSDKQHAKNLVVVLMVCKIAEHMLFHDTGFSGIELTRYTHTMTVMAMVLGYYAGHNVRELLDACKHYICTSFDRCVHVCNQDCQDSTVKQKFS